MIENQTMYILKLIVNHLIVWVGIMSHRLYRTSLCFILCNFVYNFLFFSRIWSNMVYYFICPQSANFIKTQLLYFFSLNISVVYKLFKDRSRSLSNTKVWAQFIFMNIVLQILCKFSQKIIIHIHTNQLNNPIE